MPWKRVDRSHWQNDNDRHIFWDEDRKVISAETWVTEPGHVAIVIPIDDLASLLKENRYHTFPEAMITDLIEDQERYSQATNELYHQNDYLAQRKESLENQVHATARKVVFAEDAYDKALKQIEYDGLQIIKLRKEKAELEKTVQQFNQFKLDLITAAQKEIAKWKQRVKELEEAK